MGKFLGGYIGFCLLLLVADGNKICDLCAIYLSWYRCAKELWTCEKLKLIVKKFTCSLHAKVEPRGFVRLFAQDWQS